MSCHVWSVYKGLNFEKYFDQTAVDWENLTRKPGSKANGHL
jgi:hypothetical protein